ncbi:MAG: N-acetylmuramoyl-L-alanine amidase [Flavobacteriales bacterium]|jgi:N-acetylmuramoyl-L-alanine amidase|nr:N-acetylmuramoyl-L-alanine amidase [Flavobacteriales bacterium]
MKLIYTLLIILPIFIQGQTIVIDPGHGYCADGTQNCTSNQRLPLEIETAMSVGSKLKTLLDNNCSGVTSHLTRTSSAPGDFPSLSQREIMSNNWGADRFISLHTNGGPASANGTETFWCNQGPSSNSACQTFSDRVQAAIVGAGSFTNRRSVEDDSYLNFHLGVLNNVNAVNCLSEIGFGSNSADAAKLQDNTYRDAFAQAYVDVFVNELGISCTGSTPPTLDCSNAVPLTCGVTYSGSSSNAVSNIYTYGCNSWTETGPERVHTITPTTSGTLTASISNFTGDLDVYILGSCDPSDCLGTVTGAAATYANAVAGQTYYIVVDADDGSGSSYDLVVNCPPAVNNLDCSNAIPLTCGVTYFGAASTATSNASTYGCAPTINSTGPERVHTITPSMNGTISAIVENYTGNLDVYILGSCDPSDCLGSITFNTATYTNAVAGQTYYVVVDAADGSGSSYELTVDCPNTLNCSNAVPLTCGVTYSGPASTAPSNISTYGCNNSNQTGPERVHTITPLSNGSISAVVSNFTGDLDVFILESCDASDCSGIVFQDSAILANVVAGQTYYIVVDSDNGSGSSYDLVVNCQGQSGNNEDVVVFNATVTPQTVNAGGVVTANSDHTYSGDLYTTDLNQVNMDYYLSTDCNLSNDDVYLGGSISNLGVDNPSSNEIVNLSIPVNTAPGTYFVLFAGDNGQHVTENDETNNVSCVQVTVNGAAGNNDVSLSNVTTNTDSIVAGEAIDVSSDQNYNGNQTSNNLPSSELNYYLSTDCNLSPDDVLLGDDVSNIGSDNTSSNETESLVIPINTESGTYYILFVADDNNAINESNENNNIECVMLVVDGEFVSINEKDLQNHITLYPNPTEGVITINSSEVNIQEIEIYNSNGLKLKDVELVNNEKIDLSPYANGIYYVRIVGSENEKTTFKVIKQ